MPVCGCIKVSSKWLITEIHSAGPLHLWQATSNRQIQAPEHTQKKKTHIYRVIWSECQAKVLTCAMTLKENASGMRTPSWPLASYQFYLCKPSGFWHKTCLLKISHSTACTELRLQNDQQQQEPQQGNPSLGHEALHDSHQCKTSVRGKKKQHQTLPISPFLNLVLSLPWNKTLAHTHTHSSTE